MKLLATICAFVLTAWITLVITTWSIPNEAFSDDRKDSAHAFVKTNMAVIAFSFAGLVWGVLGVVEKRGGGE